MERSSFDEGKWLSELVQNPLWRIWDIPEDELTAPQCTFVRVWAVMCEVNNGGFNQYFFNSYSAYANQAAAAFDEIGAQGAANIVRSACAAFGPAGPPVDQKARQDVLAVIDPDREAFSRLHDKRFFAESNALDLLLFEYVKANVHQFAGAAELLARSPPRRKLN